MEFHMFNIPKGKLFPDNRVPKVTLPVEPVNIGLTGTSDLVHNIVIDTCDVPDGLETIKIANEYEKFTIDTTKLVRYGTADQWVTKTVSGTGEATNAFFGSDPAPGKAKVVEVFLRKPVPIPPPPPPEPPPQTTISISYNQIASEGQNFTLTSPGTVRYGAGDKTMELNLNAGTFPCNGSTFGRDPAPGVTKLCHLKVETTVVVTPPTPEPPGPVERTWQYLTNENQPITVSGTKTVRYGKEGAWIEKEITNSGTCSNTYFGYNPAPGQTKTCEVETTVIPPTIPIVTPKRNRNPSTYTWENPILINDSWLSANGFGGTNDVVISNRNFKSTNPEVAAVTIETSRKIILQGCNFFAWQSNIGGVRGGCVKAVNYSPKVNLINCQMFGGGNPMQISCHAGRALTAQYCKEIIVKNCDMIGTSGIQIQEFFGDRSGATPTIEIMNNRFVEIDGRLSDPTNAASNFYREGNTWGGTISSQDFVIANVVQFNKVVGVPNVKVMYNEAISTANNSRFEDIVSFYLTSGTQASPMLLKGNLFRGGYVYDRWTNPNTSTYFGNNMPTSYPGFKDVRGFANSGGGGLLGDAKATTYQDDCAYVIMEDNDVLDMSNYGIGIAAGHDMTLRNNRIYRSGLVHNYTRDVRIAWGHVPIQIQDYYTKPDNYTYTAADWANGTGGLLDDGLGVKRHRWYNNDVHDNVYGYVYYHPGNGIASPKGIARNSPTRVFRDNTNILEGKTEAQVKALLTKAYVDDIVNDRRQKWINAGITVGLTS